MIKEKIIELAKKYEDYTKSVRGYLHEYPENSGVEFETSKYLKNEARELGLEVVDAEGTGFIAILDTKRPGKTIGIRADIDALPMDEAEENLVGKKKYVSKNLGSCHACGHDAHMAVGLTVAKIFTDLKDELNGKIIFIFEEDEETNYGIPKMLKLLRNYHFDAIYGNHSASFIESGKFAMEAGPRMAGTAVIDMYIKGRGGHGSRPDLSINPIFATAQVLSGLATAWANQIDVTKTVTLGIAQVIGGRQFNIFPDDVYVAGTLRFFDMEEGAKALEVVKNVSENIAKANLCTVEFTEKMRVSLNPVVNDEHLAKVARQSIIDVYGEESLVDGITWFASETFSKYSELCPTVFTNFGIANKEVGSGAEHHNVHFDIDEDALLPTVTITALINYDILNS